MERIDLVGLDDVATIEMMEQVAGHEMNQAGVALAHAVRRETEGNPFFTTEMLRHLSEAGLIFQDSTGRWVANDDLYEGDCPRVCGRSSVNGWAAWVKRPGGSCPTRR